MRAGPCEGWLSWRRKLIRLARFVGDSGSHQKFGHVLQGSLNHAVGEVVTAKMLCRLQT